MKIGQSFLLSAAFHVAVLSQPFFFYRAANRQPPIPVTLVTFVGGPGRLVGGLGSRLGRKDPLPRDRKGPGANPGEKQESPSLKTETAQILIFPGEGAAGGFEATDAGESLASLGALPAGPSAPGTPGLGEDSSVVSVGGLAGGKGGRGGKDGYTGSGQNSAMESFSRARYAFHPQPQYPERARREGWEGTVLLRVLVDRKGATKSVELNGSSGYEVLDQAAMETVKKWRFQPARSAEGLVESWVRIPVVFRLAERKD